MILKCLFVLGFPSGSLEIPTLWVLQLCMFITFSYGFPLKIFQVQSYGPWQGLSNIVLYISIRDHLIPIYWVLMVRSQMFDSWPFLLITTLSSYYKWRMWIHFYMSILKKIQRYKALFIWTKFIFCIFSPKIWDTKKTPNSQNGVHSKNLGNGSFSLSQCLLFIYCITPNLTTSPRLRSWHFNF
jgi:hypothetical protein